jgi:hypothetical protein
VDRFGEPEHHQRSGGDERRMQALRQIKVVEHPNHGAATKPPDNPAKNRLLREQYADLKPRLVAGEQDFNQNYGEKNGERIVGPGLDLERRTNTRPQPKPLGVQQEKHGSGIGRGHHRANQQRLGPVQLQRPDRDRRD